LFAKILREVQRIHGTNRIDVIHAHSALPCGHTAALLSRELNIPFVVTVHGLDAYSTNQVKGFAGQWCQRISRLVYRSACRVICVSEKVREQVTQGVVSVVTTSVIYNGVDPDLFTSEQTCNELEVILSVGGLIPIKGHELLIRGPERGRLETLAARLKMGGRVHFHGRQSRQQVAESMRRCAVFVLPSRYEALGCVYLEAMSLSKPVIACRDQGIGEVIQDSHNGCLVDIGNVQQMSNTLAMLLEDRTLRQRVGVEARQTVISSFMLAHQAAHLVQTYEECAQ
jgi:glycosyltransferase involved in cell wall biosynthesis